MNPSIVENTPAGHVFRWQIGAEPPGCEENIGKHCPKEASLFEQLFHVLRQRNGAGHPPTRFRSRPDFSGFNLLEGLVWGLATVPNILTLVAWAGAAACFYRAFWGRLASQVALAYGGAGLILLALALVCIPRLPAVRPALRLPRPQYPAMYQLADRLAGELGTKPVAEIQLDFQPGLSSARFGGIRKRIMVLSLPLLMTLEDQEWVALLALETAHFASHDLARHWWIVSALETLNAWHQALSMGREQPAARSGWGWLKWVKLPLVGLVWGWGYMLAVCLWKQKQASEYRAEWLCAQVSGTPALFRLLAHEGVQKELLPEQSEYLKKQYVPTPLVTLSPSEVCQIQQECRLALEPFINQGSLRHRNVGL